MKLIFISTTLPMQCGLATFNGNLKSAIQNSDISNVDSFTIAISDAEDLTTYSFPNDVKFIVRKKNKADYINAANIINNSDADACILQHEFGIFGGNDGLYVLNLLSQIKKPVITIMHTVLKTPNYNQQIIVQQIAKFSQKIVVMNHKAISMLHSIYNIQADKLQYIAHGVPNLEPKINNEVKLQYPFKDKKVLLTFGLISRGKGLETVIEALPAIVKNHPDVVYVILGNTHPDIIKNNGEEYRDSLKDLAKKLNVEKHVIFINKFVDEEELYDYLTASEIYITPYLNEAQITSGTLSYAIGAGCAVISTPYWHATELLQNKRGILFDFKNAQQLANITTDLLNDNQKLNNLKKEAYQFGLGLRWPVIGSSYIKTINQISSYRKLNQPFAKTIINTDAIPKFSLEHINRLTDSTGIFQHATYSVPNFEHGYCLDDNARALLMATLAYEQFKDKDALKIIPIYLSYVQYMQNGDGSFRNFLSFDRNFLDEIGSDDSYGRTMWALAYLIGHAPNNAYKEFANEIFINALPFINKLNHLRGIADTLIGISLYLKSQPEKKELVSYLHLLKDKLITAYKNNSEQGWCWFEEKLTYDNAILPLALWYSYDYLQDDNIYKIAEEAQAFLTQHTLNTDYFNPVGNNGWLFKNQEMAQYDQQAIETMAMVIMLYKAFEITKNVDYLNQLNTCFQWFLGVNSLGLSLYDEETKGCADGLQNFSVNRNQGAESTLAYLISYLYTYKAVELEYQGNSLSFMENEILKV
jgi:glycosyltransferase involved in cell wall biosynthesis